MTNELNERGLSMFMKDSLKALIFGQILESLMEDVTEFDLLPAGERLKIHTLITHGQKPHLHLAKDC